MIKWFNAKERNGIASLYDNSITLNTIAMYPIQDAYRVQVGFDGNSVIVKPLSKDVVESGVLDEFCILKLDTHKSFARIASTVLMKQIASEVGLELSKKPLKYETKWDSVENILIIDTKKGVK